jgi:RNA polymerase sigma-70 factor (ECF subfamily)
MRLMPDLSDEELIEAYRASVPGVEADAFINELFQRYHSRVALWCLRISGNRESAADLAQDVFLKVFRNLDSFRGASKFSTWLYTVARNHCFTEMKSQFSRQERTFDPLVDEPADTAPDPHQILERENSDAALRELVRRTLTETESRVMTLHYAEELPLDTITRLLDLQNASGAKAHIVNARRKLGHALARWKAQARPPRR